MFKIIFHLNAINQMAKINSININYCIEHFFHFSAQGGHFWDNLRNSKIKNNKDNNINNKSHLRVLGNHKLMKLIIMK